MYEEFPYEAVSVIILTFSVFFLAIKLFSSRFGPGVLVPNRTITVDNDNVSIPTTVHERVFNPYIISCIKCSDNERLLLEVKSFHPSWMLVAWGVLVSEIYPLIHSSCLQLLDCDYTSEKISKISLHLEKYYIPAECLDLKTFLLNKPYMELGSVPRNRYPLVILLMSSEFSHDINLKSQRSNQIVGLVSFVHVKDSVCSANTHIFDQYVKTVDNKLHNIKTVYVASDESNENRSDGHESPNHDNRTKSRVCIVCVSQIITRVLLPCRHACLCENCIEKLVCCPICRSAISSTFKMWSDSNS